MKKYIVNKRAIDSDELLQIILASNGIYESTLEETTTMQQNQLRSPFKHFKKA
ncbi:hypothetical protein [Enterococcus hirae]|uniref:hypothetical protein n=1 Tax=Enterococcus hirae TaxID=1354 RepID=UPI0021AB1A17|nr:hypothetical protein [Enterococcus hirae]